MDRRPFHLSLCAIARNDTADYALDPGDRAGTDPIAGAGPHSPEVRDHRARHLRMTLGRA
ncbi:hypothetical protein AA102526_2026 [Asaia lannensis NBRC 102526]|nr:hypothetical protein AA102526_2026 [Asaia lannensis NBRC 102526]